MQFVAVWTWLDTSDSGGVGCLRQDSDSRRTKWRQDGHLMCQQQLDCAEHHQEDRKFRRHSGLTELQAQCFGGGSE